MKTLKKSNPIELLEYCKPNKLEQELGLSWWVPDILQKRDQMCENIIGAGKGKNKKYFQTTHKLGIRLSKTVANALEIDQLKGDSLW